MKKSILYRYVKVKIISPFLIWYLKIEYGRVKM